jgi:hypothetical protein
MSQVRKALRFSVPAGGEIVEMDADGGDRRTLAGNLLDNIDGITINRKMKTAVT